MPEQLLRTYIRDHAAKRVDSAEMLHNYSGDFSLSDKKACDDCKGKDGCDMCVLNVHSDYEVEVLSLEKWLSFFPEKELTNLKNCDFFISDGVEQYASKNVAFCDITCLQEKYLAPGSHKYAEGKREYAIRQMVGMADFFNSDELLGHFIHTATSRRFILGVRSKRAEGAGVAA